MRPYIPIKRYIGCLIRTVIAAPLLLIALLSAVVSLPVYVWHLTDRRRVEKKINKFNNR